MAEEAQVNAGAAAPVPEGNAPVVESAAPAGPTLDDKMGALRDKLGLKVEPARVEPEKPSAPVVAEPTAAELADYAARRAALARADRARVLGEKKLAEERAALAAEQAEAGALKKAREAWKTPGQRAAAIREAFGDLTEETMFEIAAAVGVEPKALTAEDVEKLVAQRLADEAKKAADAAKAADQAKSAARAETEASIIGNIGKTLAEKASDYPAVMHRGVTAERVRELLIEGVKATGKIPEPDVVLGFLEQEFRAEMLSLPFIPKPTETPRAPKTFGAGDKRGVTTTDAAPPKRATLRDAEADVLSKIRAAAGARG